jgi:hypothetical protein
MGAAMIESVLVCAAGSVIAIAVLAATSTLLATLLPPLLARYAAGATDARLIGVTLLVALACALAAGVTPAWRVARVDVLSVLQHTSSNRQRSRLRGGRSLIVVESALAVLLVLSGLLLLRSFSNFSTENLGFVPDDLFTVSIRPASPVRSSLEAALADYQRSLEALEQMPGVLAAGGADVTVMAGQGANKGISTTGTPPGGRYQVSSRYFETLRTPLLADVRSPTPRSADVRPSRFSVPRRRVTSSPGLRQSG